MKSSTLLIGFLLATCLINAQPGSTEYFTTTAKDRKFLVELSANTGVVYQIGHYFDKGISGPIIVYTDTIKLANFEVIPHIKIYNGRRARVSPNGNGWSLNAEVNTKGKRRTFSIFPESSAAFNREMNHAYWLQHFTQMTDSLSKMYPLTAVSFRTAFVKWDSVPNKELPHSEFRGWANQRINAERDTLIALIKPASQLTESLLGQLETIAFDSLKAGIIILNSHPELVKTVTEAVIDKRPELYFRLAEELPNQRSAIFDASYGHKSVKKLARQDPQNAVKKEFLQTKKKDRWTSIGLIGVAAAGAALMTAIVFVLF